MHYGLVNTCSSLLDKVASSSRTNQVSFADGKVLHVAIDDDTPSFIY